MVVFYLFHIHTPSKHQGVTQNHMVVYLAVLCMLLELQRAIEAQHIDQLRAAIKTVENKRYITRLQREYDQAKKLVLSLVRIEKLRHAVMELDRKTMAEIRSYSRSPKLVHYVMRASLLLLGDHEGKTKVTKIH